LNGDFSEPLSLANCTAFSKQPTLHHRKEIAAKERKIIVNFALHPDIPLQDFE
jgi:hypothetical protein